MGGPGGAEGQTVVNHLTDEEVDLELLPDKRMWEMSFPDRGGCRVSDGTTEYDDGEIFKREAWEKDGNCLWRRGLLPAGRTTRKLPEAKQAAKSEWHLKFIIA